jgi:hypothetical protein
VHTTIECWSRLKDECIKIAELALNNNHSLTERYMYIELLFFIQLWIDCDEFLIVCWQISTQRTTSTKFQNLKVLRSVYFMVKFLIFIPELWDFIHQIVRDFKTIFRMSHCKLRTPLPIHFKLRIVNGIDSQFTARHTKNRLQFD